MYVWSPCLRCERVGELPTEDVLSPRILVLVLLIRMIQVLDVGVCIQLLSSDEMRYSCQCPRLC